MKGILYFFTVIALWIIVQILIDARNPCSNFAPGNRQGNCQQDIER